jgi:tetratricopeptide (TPR) repeat protein
MHTTKYAIVVLALLARPLPSRADDPPAHIPTAKEKADAKAHIAAGTKLYNVQQYDKAADEYQQAYLLDPRPEYLYASAQAQRLGGDCEKAIRSYQAYLRANPPEAERGKAEKNITRCEEDLKVRASGEPLPPPEEMPPLPPAPPEPPPEPEPTHVVPPPPPPPPGKSYAVGHLLVGGGVVVAGAGTYFFMTGRNKINDINAAATYDDFMTKRTGFDAAKTQQTFGFIGIAAGVALVGGGIAYYVLHASSEEAPTIAPTITPGGAGVTVGGSF